MKRTIIYAMALLLFGIFSCTNERKEQIKTEISQSLKSNNMKSYITMFEIPATKISRAIDFYQAILDIKIEKMEIAEMQMGILPYEEQLVTGVIIQADGYKPSADGITIYLNGGDNLQVILDRVEKNGGQIFIPKTPHADESGYFAIFIDSEGNKIGLNSAQ